MIDDTWFDLPVLTGYFVYALFGAEDAANPLYIGQSVNPLSRVGIHLADSYKRPEIARVVVRPCSSKEDMDETEVRLIRAYRPPWNVAKLGPDRGFWRTPKPAPEKPQQEASPYLVPSEVSDRLGCPLDEVKALIKSGALEATPHMHWTSRRVHVDSLDTYLRAYRPELLAGAAS